MHKNAKQVLEAIEKFAFLTSQSHCAGGKLISHSLNFRNIFSLQKDKLSALLRIPI